MEPGHAETAAAGIEPVSNLRDAVTEIDVAFTGQTAYRNYYNGASGAGDVTTATISELIEELQMMLTEAKERQQLNPRLSQVVPVGGARWREVHSRLISQTGAPSCSLESSSSLEAIELQAQLQQSSSALKSSQQQLEALSSRVEELEASLEAEVERMVASVQMELDTAHERHQAELRKLQERLELREEEAAAATEREATLKEALRTALHDAQEANAETEMARNFFRDLQLRMSAYEDLCWKLQMELQSVSTFEGMTDMDANPDEGPRLSLQRPSSPESLLVAARALILRLRDQTVRGAAAADAVAADAAADAASWRKQAERAEADAMAASLAAEELRNSLGAALAAIQEEAAVLSVINAGLTSDLERHQAQVAHLISSNADLEAQVVRMSSEVSSLVSLQNALKADLLDADERHAAMTAEVSQLREELLQERTLKDAFVGEVLAVREESEKVRSQNATLEAQALKLDGDLHAARARGDLQHLNFLEERRHWEKKRQRVEEEGARLAALAVERLVATEGSDARSRACAAKTAAALEEALGVTSTHLAHARRAAQIELEKSQRHVMDLYERLGQLRTRLVAESARNAEACEAGRAAERAMHAGLRDEAAAAAAAALCSRAFRAVERAASTAAVGDTAMALAAAQHHVVQQTSKAIFARVMRREEAREAEATALNMASRMAQVEEQHADTLATLAAARLTDQAAAAARVQALENQLANFQDMRDNLSGQSAELQGHLEHNEAMIAVFKGQLKEMLETSAAAITVAEAARKQLTTSETNIRQMQNELEAAQRELSESSEASQSRIAVMLTARAAVEGQLAGALATVDMLQEQLNTAKFERQQLERELKAAERNTLELSEQLATVKTSSVELAAKLTAECEERGTLIAQLKEERTALLELEAQVAAANAVCNDLLVQRDAATSARDLMLLKHQEEQELTRTERQQLAGELTKAKAARDALEGECVLRGAKVREVHAELEGTQVELQKVLLELEHERNAHASTNILLDLQRATCARLQNQIQREHATPAGTSTVSEGMPPLLWAQGMPVLIPPGEAAEDAIGDKCLPTIVGEGTLSHHVNLDGAAKCGAQGMGGSAETTKGSAGRTWGSKAGSEDTLLEAAVGLPREAWPSDGMQTPLESSSVDLPKYDQMYDHHKHVGPAGRGSEAMRVTNVLWPPTAAALQPGCTLAMLSGSCASSGMEEQAVGINMLAHETLRRRNSSNMVSPVASVSQSRAVSHGVSLRKDEATGEGELDLRRQLSALRDLLEAEREAHVARVITLRAFRSAERTELQRQLAIVAASLVTATVPNGKRDVRVGAEGALLLQLHSQRIGPEPLIEGPSTTNTLPLPYCAAARSSAPTSGDGLVGTFAPIAGEEAQRRISDPQRHRTGLPPLPPANMQDQEQHTHPRPSLERLSRQHSISSTGSSSYWLPAAAAIAAAAADYDPYQEPMWMANAAFGAAVSLGCPSSATPSETQVMELADTIATLRAELAASQEALRKERSMAGQEGTHITAVGSCGIDSSNPLSREIENPDRADLMTAVLSTVEEPALVSSPTLMAGTVLADTNGRSEDDQAAALVCAVQMECAENTVREVMLRVMRAVESKAMQQDLAEARAACAVATANANCVRMRLSTLLATHARVCGEMEVIRAARDELAAEVGPYRCAIARLHTRNEQLLAEVCEMEAQRASEVDAAAAAAMEAAARLTASQAREAAVSARCEELAAKCKELEAQLRSGATTAPLLKGTAETESRLAEAEATRLQLETQILELRSELTHSAAKLERLRTDYISARQDRQRLQQQLALLLAQSAAVQEAAAELCSSLRTAHADLDQQKSKLDEQRSEVARVQAESAAARQQLARARADGRQRAAETRAWARQALLLQEQLALMVQGAQTVLPQVAMAKDVAAVTALPQEDTNSFAVSFPATASAVRLTAGAVQRPSHETTSGTSATALLRGAGWASASCDLSIGRRCLSDIDLSSLPERAGEAAVAVELFVGQAAPGRTQQPHQLPAHDVATPPWAGLSSSLHPVAWATGPGGAPYLPGLAPINVHHLSLLQGRGALNPWTIGRVDAQMRQLVDLRLRANATIGGASSAAMMTAAANPLQDGKVVSKGASAVCTSLPTHSGSNAAEKGSAGHADTPRTAASLISDGLTSRGVASSPSEPSLPAAVTIGEGAQDSVMASSDWSHNRSRLQQPDLAQGLPGHDQQLVFRCIREEPSESKPEFPPETSVAARCRTPFLRSQSVGGLSPIPVNQKTRSAWKLRSLDEEHECQRQEQDQKEVNRWLRRKRETWMGEGYEIPEEDEGPGEGDDGDCDEAGLADGGSDTTSHGLGLSLGRVASETDMHLFINPMFASSQESFSVGAGRRSRQVLPASARAPSDDASYVTDLHAALGRARAISGHHTLPAAAGHAYPSRSLDINSNRSDSTRLRRLSADQRTGVSRRTQLMQRLPRWPAQVGAVMHQQPTLGMGPMSGPPLGAFHSGGGDNGDCERLVPVSRSNPVVKLYKKISRRLSSASRDSREGL